MNSGLFFRFSNVEILFSGSDKWFLLSSLSSLLIFNSGKSTKFHEEILTSYSVK